MKCVLITGRTTEQGVALESGKTSPEYYEKVALAFMNEKDMEELGLKENSPVRVSSRFGSVVVRCRKGDLDRNSLFMPLGPWSSILIGSKTGGTGMPEAKGLECEVSKSGEEFTTLESILRMLRE